jgi:RNA:NAD 2'-phosphotransferase (TPT1/KptA family)
MRRNAKEDNTSNRKVKFAQLFTDATEIVDSRLENANHRSAPLTYDQLISLKEELIRERTRALENRITADEGHTYPLKGVADWGEPPSELLTALNNIEIFYRRHYQRTPNDAE